MDRPSSGAKEFFDISDKLSAPAKKSLREKQKEETEAKRKREEEEAKIALKDFQRSLDVDEDDHPDGRLVDSGPVRVGSTRHFAPRGPRASSGPGSLGPLPPALSKKRGRGVSHKDRDHALFAYSNSGPLDTITAFCDSDEEDEGLLGSKTVEKAVSKPTMHLSSLPPGMTASEIKDMIPSTLAVEAVSVAISTESRSNDRKSKTAIVTLAQNTPAKEIDSVVNALEKRYLGYGFNLSISRHLSSLSLETQTPSLANVIPSSLPFGAKPVPGAPGQSMSRAPPPSSLRARHNYPVYNTSRSQLGRGFVSNQVVVQTPSDIRQLKLINKTIELLLNNGLEFEALLMSRPEVQKDPRWEWLWNARSTNGVWYRWKLWEIITGARQAPNAYGSYTPCEHSLFYDSAPWIPPELPLPFEFTTNFEEFASDPDYDSSDEEAADDDGLRRPKYVSGGPPETERQTEDALNSYLNPLKQSKLVHLLARLPTTTTKLRRGDVARVSYLAISHADKGADEIVNTLVRNIQKPFALTSANPENQGPEDETEQGAILERKAEKDDPSSAKLIALYVISDIFASCGTCGVRQAWRYREWFETAFKKRKLFEHLGRLEKELQWGRLKSEKWKRSINNLLSMWDSGNVFSPIGQAHFVEVFNTPPIAQEEVQVTEKVEQDASKAPIKSKWKPVEVQAEACQEKHQAFSIPMGEVDDVDGEPMPEEVGGGDPVNEDVDGEPMEGVNDAEAHNRVHDGLMTESKSMGTIGQTSVASQGARSNDDAGMIEVAKARRRRPKAEDMFADSGGE